MGREIGNIIQNPALASPTRPIGVIIGGVLADLAAVLVFVTIGRLSHEEGLSVSGLLRTGWPFAIGVIGGYIGIALTRWPLLSLRGGAVIVGKTAVIGLVLRYGIAHDGAPFSFVVVTVLVLSALMLGWRAATLGALRRAAARRV
ncbi:MAG TPA: DUF3054 domain-containing protein [Kineosporiaceae bacterium]|nr:DUF3054 domain-containing protein [Kineosporiaceae bacterium]